MKLLRRIFYLSEILTVIVILVMLYMFYSGSLGYNHIKLFLSITSFFLVVFIFLNCTDDYKTPLEKLFRFIGWAVLLSGLGLIILLYEGISPDGFWPWLNTIIVLGLFTAQLSEINEMKKKSDLLVLTHFLVSIAAFVMLFLTIMGNPVSFTLLFAILGLNFITMMIVVLNGKIS